MPPCEGYFGACKDDDFIRISSRLISTYTYDPISSNRQRYIFTIQISDFCLLKRGCKVRVTPDYRFKTVAKE